MLLASLASDRMAGPIIGLAANFYPNHLIQIVPDRAQCGEWTRNAHAQPLVVGGIDLGAQVSFTPRCWRFGGMFDARAVLLHEIVHAFRHLTGSWKYEVGPTGYPNIEEFHAVTVANVFLSALGHPLRLGYEFGDPVYAELISMVSVPAAARSQGGALQMRGAALPTSHPADRVIRATPAQLIAFSRVFAQRHAGVSSLFRETSMLANVIGGLPESWAAFNPYRASRFL
jgi:hypothetical protein